MSGLSLNTSDYSKAFDAQHARELRRRFISYCCVVIGFIVLLRLAVVAGVLIASEVSQRSLETADNESLIAHWSAVIRVGLYAWALVFILRRNITPQRILRTAMVLVIASGSIQVLANVVSLFDAAHVAHRSVFDLGGSKAFGLGIYGAVAVFITHFFACLFLPWKPRESLRAVVPLLLLNALVMLVFGHRSLLMTVLTLLILPAAAVPGLAVSAWRFSRFRDRFAVEQLKGSYREIRRELIDARRLHEALFPPPLSDGPLRFDYLYEPMRQIGGDYLFARSIDGPEGPRAFNVLVVDVTGHGIAAALTVNRLYGEIERLFAESPDASPGEVLTALNRYVHLTLARHSVYVTALCIRIDLERNVLEYASGGHPPAFIAACDGTIDELDSTSFVLGACAGSDFDPCQQTRTFAPGDTLIAYTDGAIEVRSEEGKMLGIAGLRRILSMHTQTGRGSSYARSVISAVDRHRAGPIEDDTLVVEIHRPIAPAQGGGNAHGRFTTAATPDRSPAVAAPSR